MTRALPRGRRKTGHNQPLMEPARIPRFDRRERRERPDIVPEGEVELAPVCEILSAAQSGQRRANTVCPSGSGRKLSGPIPKSPCRKVSESPAHDPASHAPPGSAAKYDLEKKCFWLVEIAAPLAAPPPWNPASAERPHNRYREVDKKTLGERGEL